MQDTRSRGMSVARTIDDQQLNGFSLRVVGICFLVVVLEGYDVSVPRNLIAQLKRVPGATLLGTGCE